MPWRKYYAVYGYDHHYVAIGPYDSRKMAEREAGDQFRYVPGGVSVRVCFELPAGMRLEKHVRNLKDPQFGR